MFLNFETFKRSIHLLHLRLCSKRFCFHDSQTVGGIWMYTLMFHHERSTMIRLQLISCSLFKASSFHYSICAAPGFPFNVQLPTQKTNHNTSQVQNTPSHSHSLLTSWTSWHFPQRFPSTGSPVPCSNDPLPCSTNPMQQSWTKCSPAPKIQQNRDWRVKEHP